MADRVVDKIKERMTHLRLGDSLDKVINPSVRMHRKGYSTWSVCVSVCLSIISNLASHTIMRPTRNTRE